MNPPQTTKRAITYVALGSAGALGLACVGVDILQIMLGLDASAVNLSQRLAGSSLQHPLGTDELGRDHLLRLLYGGQVSLIVGFATALITAFLGALIGLLAGYFGGWIDALLMRLTDSMIALPLLPLLLVLSVVDLEKLGLDAIASNEWASLYRVILIVALTGWTSGARLVRAAALSVRERAFVQAAQVIGASPWRVMVVHILPNAASPLIVATALSVGQVILLESALSFLGFGIQPPTPSWGNMLADAQDLIWEAPGLIIWPGVAIVITVVATNLAGDMFQDYLDRSGR